MGREVADGRTKSNSKKTKFPYDMTELQWCRREHKNIDAEQVGMAVVGAARRYGPTPSQNPSVLS